MRICVIKRVRPILYGTPCRQTPQQCQQQQTPMILKNVRKRKSKQHQSDEQQQQQSPPQEMTQQQQALVSMLHHQQTVQQNWQQLQVSVYFSKLSEQIVLTIKYWITQSSCAHSS